MNSDANVPVVIAGAGPAGLTAALELLRARPGLAVVVVEALDQVGGLARTVVHNGNRMDIGGHRFFSKSDWVMKWWKEMIPLPKGCEEGDEAAWIGVVPESDRVMLVRSRLSRIYFLRRFFAYPIALSAATLRNLGLLRVLRIGVTYLFARLFPRRPERHLEDFFVNRFGTELYETFFRDYTEKVWGVPCREISPAWGAQRIKSLSVTRAVLHALKGMLRSGQGDVAQKDTQTSLIERFLYPKFGPGQMWQCAAEELVARGGRLLLSTRVTGVRHESGRVTAVKLLEPSGASNWIPASAFISTMPVSELFEALDPPAPAPVASVAQGLRYRDFISVGLLVRRLSPAAGARDESGMNLVPDNWIYIQEPDVRIGRLQVFNNWSPGLVAPGAGVWLGLEYFCQEGDDLWRMADAELAALGAAELAKIGLIESADHLDSRVVRAPKAYPAYFGSFDRFDEIRRFADELENLYLVGRNGMHRYNNQDHSMLTARLAAQLILGNPGTKDDIWRINVDDAYHEDADGAANAGDGLGRRSS